MQNNFNKIFVKYFIILSLFLSIGSCKKAYIEQTETCLQPYADSSASHPKHVLFQSILNKYVKKGLPGIAVCIEDEHGVWVGSAGKSDIAQNIDYQPCTISKAASITKMMFATVVMQLREKGIVNLNDKASKWLDADIVKQVANLDQVTLRDLMQHSTGIYDIITGSDFYLAVLNNPNKKWAGKDLIKFAYGKEPMEKYAPNAVRGWYSNTNTLLLTMCIEKITGRPHNELFHEMLIDKLGMSSTFYQAHDALPAQTAQGYYDLYNNGTIVKVSNLTTGSGNGYGGIFTNVLDLHKFMKALFIDKILVNQQSLDLMQTFIADDETGNLGVGLLQQYKQLNTGVMGIGHSGRDVAYSGDAHYFPDRNNRIFINLVNYGTNGNTPLRDVFYAMREEFALELMKP